MKIYARSTGPLSSAILSLATAAVTLHTQLAADTFGSGANAFTIDFVNIGNAPNAADNTGYGAVNYSYRMGTYDVSRDMIDKANSAGGLGIAMSDMTSHGGNGANRPATGVSWYAAATFVNWLNTSTGHAPAYKFDGTTFELWSPGDAGYNAVNPYRNSQALYVLPSENEWYKAAYYDPNKNGGPGYWLYPTGSDTPPTAVVGGTAAGTAVYNQLPSWPGPADVANAGGLSLYGTMGQGGNVWQWLESAYDGVNDSATEDRGQRGGDWNNTAFILASATRGHFDPSSEVFNYNHGFRVAAVPEPMESAGVFGALALGFALWRRRGSR